MQDPTPIWDLIGRGFVEHYYNLFDNDRAQLTDLYVSVTVITLLLNVCSLLCQSLNEC